MPELSEEEKQEILMRDDFQRFLNKTCRLVERAIHEDDIFVDYTGETNDDQNRCISGQPPHLPPRILAVNTYGFDVQLTRLCSHVYTTCRLKYHSKISVIV